ncbi:MAG TPA: hypothetical protein VEB59_12750 [Gemmatimonadales bacterium]|nr:hypothetical protein [Gemmatimonadales bacterium]
MLIRRDAAIVACLLCRTEEGRRLRKVLAQVVIPQMLDGQAQISTQAVTPVQLAALATTLNDAAERREAQYWARLEAKLAEHQARSDQRDEQIAEIASRRYFDDQPKLRWQKRTDERWLASSAFLVFQHDWFLASNLVERARRDRMLHEGLRAIAPGPDGEFDSFELGRFITRHSDRDIPDGDVIWRIEVMPKEKRRRGVGNFYRVWGRPRDAALPIPATPLFPAPPPAGGTP